MSRAALVLVLASVPAGAALRGDDLLFLHRRGYSEEVLLRLIDRKGVLRTGPAELLRLRKAGLPQRVLLAYALAPGRTAASNGSDRRAASLVVANRTRRPLYVELRGGVLELGPNLSTGRRVMAHGTRRFDVSPGKYALRIGHLGVRSTAAVLERLGTRVEILPGRRVVILEGLRYFATRGLSPLDGSGSPRLRPLGRDACRIRYLSPGFEEVYEGRAYSIYGGGTSRPDRNARPRLVVLSPPNRGIR